MAYIFLDESGDLGFNFKKKNTTDYFVIAFLFVDDKKPIEKIVKNIFRGFTKKEIKSHSGTLHSYKEKEITRKRLLKSLSTKYASILLIYLNKRKVYSNLQNEKHVLYNYVVNILLDRLCTKKLIKIDKEIKLIASKRETNRFLNENFANYLKKQISVKHKLDISIEIKTPKEEKGLQIVDCVSWSGFRKYEHKDDSYWKVIKKLVVEENGLFP